MPNLNPSVNTAGATVEWRSGAMVVVNAYGFEAILDNSAVNTGQVLLIPDEGAGSIDGESFVIVSVLKPESAGLADTYTNTVEAQRKPASLAAPDSHGRKYLSVQGHFADVAGVQLAKVSFCIVVQKTVPGPLPEGSGDYPYGDLPLASKASLR